MHVRNAIKACTRTWGPTPSITALYALRAEWLFFKDNPVSQAEASSWKLHGSNERREDSAFSCPCRRLWQNQGYGVRLECWNVLVSHERRLRLGNHFLACVFCPHKKLRQKLIDMWQKRETCRASTTEFAAKWGKMQHNCCMYKKMTRGKTPLFELLL